MATSFDAGKGISYCSGHHKGGDSKHGDDNSRTILTYLRFPLLNIYWKARFLDIKLYCKRNSVS